MDFRLVGDEHAGHEIIFKLKQWDDAICKMDVQNIIRLCQSDVSLFDIGFELQGVQAYQELWRRYAPFFQGEIKVFRRNINIFSRDGLAFLHCYSKLDHASGVASAESPYVFKKRQVSGWLPISIFRCLWTLKLKCQSRFIFQTEFD